MPSSEVIMITIDRRTWEAFLRARRWVLGLSIALVSVGHLFTIAVMWTMSVRITEALDMLRAPELAEALLVGYVYLCVSYGSSLLLGVLFVLFEWRLLRGLHETTETNAAAIAGLTGANQTRH